MIIERRRDWQAGHSSPINRLGCDDMLLIEHSDGRVTRYEFDSDDEYIFVYTRRWLRTPSLYQPGVLVTVDKGYDPVRRFRRRPTQP